jgi:hypothetical protein
MQPLYLRLLSNSNKLYWIKLLRMRLMQVINR